MFLDYVALGARIRSYRKALHLTQEEFADMCGISLSFLGHIERGSRKASLETLVSICNALNVSPHLLLQDSLNDTIRGVPVGGEKEKHQNLLREVSELLMKYDQED